ncbi:hypothetical protein MRX96_042270 [Rhipicephalus microplus]
MNDGGRRAGTRSPKAKAAVRASRRRRWKASRSLQQWQAGTSPPKPLSAADATRPYKAGTPLDPEAACVCERCIRRLHNAPGEPPLLAGPIGAAGSLVLHPVHRRRSSSCRSAIIFARGGQTDRRTAWCSAALEGCGL